MERAVLMPRLVAIAICLAASSGCLRQITFHCEASSDCVAAGGPGVCEANGYCSFDDGSCAGGRRFGEYSAGYSSQCVGGDLPDGGVDVPVPVDDRDNDGVLNVNDNCPDVANTDQGDEDQDGLGDVCDPCPPDPINTDGDGDGVGDACDPHPAVGGDKIELFEGFHAGIPATWEKIGTWSVANDSAIGAGSLATLTVPNARAKTVVSAATTFEALTATTSTAGVIDRYASTGDAGISCSVFVVTGNSGVSVFQTNNGQASNRTTLTGNITTGVRYTMKQTRDGDNYECAGNAVTTPPPYANALNNTTAGLHVVGATAHFEWLMIISSP